VGKETVRLGKMGKFECMKFSIYTIAGKVFKGGETLDLWVTDDENKMPVKVKTPILIGSIKAKLKKVEGLKYDMSAKID
jgi:hypothetical protein